VGEDVVVAQVAVDRIGLGRETDRAAIGGTDGKRIEPPSEANMQ
jgi:hypothetical protein